VVLAMSAWDVWTTPPAEQQGIMVRVYLSDMRHSLSLTKSARVGRDRLEIKAFANVPLSFVEEAFEGYQNVHRGVGSKLC
jgi:hypothetical protein